MGGVLAESFGVDVPDKYIIREWNPSGETENGMLHGKHQFGTVGSNVITFLERRNNVRMLSGVIPCLACLNCCWMPSRVFDVQHMTGAPISTVATEQTFCPVLQCCCPALRPVTNVRDVSSMPPVVQGQPPRDQNAGGLMGSVFTPCFLDCCFHPWISMASHVRDENDKPKFRLVLNYCQPAILGNCFCLPLACCYEMHYDIHPVAEGDDTKVRFSFLLFASHFFLLILFFCFAPKGCCNGFKLGEPVGSVAAVMNTPIQRMVESQTGLAKQRARLVLPPGLKESDALVMLPLLFWGMTAQAQSADAGGQRGAPASITMER